VATGTGEGRFFTYKNCVAWNCLIRGMSVLNLNLELNRVPGERGREASHLIKPLLKNLCSQQEKWRHMSVLNRIFKKSQRAFIKSCHLIKTALAQIHHRGVKKSENGVLRELKDTAISNN